MFTNFNDMSSWYEDMDYLDALYCLPLRDWLLDDRGFFLYVTSKRFKAK